MDITKLKTFGWKANITLEDGIKKVYDELNKKRAFISDHINTIV
jgi:hypothetical protein